LTRLNSASSPLSQNGPTLWTFSFPPPSIRSWSGVTPPLSFSRFPSSFAYSRPGSSSVHQSVTPLSYTLRDISRPFPQTPPPAVSPLSSIAILPRKRCECTPKVFAFTLTIPRIPSLRVRRSFGFLLSDGPFLSALTRPISLKYPSPPLFKPSAMDNCFSPL